MSFPFETAAEVVRDPLMGRCLVASRDFSPGEALWCENAYVSADNEEDDVDSFDTDSNMWTIMKKCNNKGEKKKKKSKTVSQDRAMELTNALADLPSVAALDIARCLMGLIIKALDAPSSALDNNTQLFLQLAPSNIENCVSDVAQFRDAYIGALPEKLTTEFIGGLLGVLNNNQMELEDIVGAGLFVATAIVEHSCKPNCSYSTSNTVLYMMATESIKKGDRLSIDYGNNYCRPTFFRRIYLQKTYKFFCICEACVGPDRSRCFVCPSCKDGSVCAVSPSDEAAVRAEIITAVESGEEPDVIYIPGFYSLSSCSSCQVVPSKEFCEQAAQEEERVCSSGLVQKNIESSEDCAALCNEVKQLTQADDRVLLDTHYLMYWAMDKAADFCSQSASAGLCSYSEALERTIEVVRLLEICLPPLHHEKVVFYDKLGQLAVANGDIAAASAYFSKAFDMSCLVCGVDNPSTMKLQALATDTPTSVQELISHYNNAAGIVNDEGDDGWEDEDEDHSR